MAGTGQTLLEFYAGKHNGTAAANVRETSLRGSQLLCHAMQERQSVMARSHATLTGCFVWAFGHLTPGLRQSTDAVVPQSLAGPSSSLATLVSIG